jgi:hypothetical protein
MSLWTRLIYLRTRVHWRSLISNIPGRQITDPISN